MYLLDTDYLINFLKGREEVIRVIQSLKSNSLYTSIICVAETLEGIYNYADKKTLVGLEKLLEIVKVLDIDMKVATKYSFERVKLRKLGKLIDKFDLLIASTCLANNLTLVTGNKKHFGRIKSLKFY